MILLRRRRLRFLPYFWLRVYQLALMYHAITQILLGEGTCALAASSWQWGYGHGRTGRRSAARLVLYTVV